MIYTKLKRIFAVVDATIAFGIDCGEVDIGFAFGAVLFSGFQQGSAGGTIATHFGIGKSHNEVCLIKVFLVGEVLDGILRVVDGIGIFLFTVAHAAHAHGGAGRRLQFVKVLGGGKEDLVVGAALLHHNVSNLLQQVGVLGVGL